MLNRLVVYARLIYNAKSEVIHLKSKHSAQVPTFVLASAAKKCSDLFRYLGKIFRQTRTMITLSEHAAIPMLAAAHLMRRFVRDTALCDRPFASLWLA